MAGTKTRTEKLTTPIPWRMQQFDDDPRWTFIGSDGQGLAKTVGLSNDRLNAEFIVRAVNCHQELLDACKAAFRLMNYQVEAGEQMEIHAKVNAAIKKAENGD